MADKLDYYQELGVAKTATKAEIKTAYQRIVMKNHPDAVKHKDWPQAQKDAAIEKFKAATEAEGVLSDDMKRATYDKYGFKGIENLANGKSAASGRSYEEVAGPTIKRTYSEEDTMSFFEKSRERREKEEVKDGQPGLSGDELRAKAREERLRRRGRSDTPSTPSTPAANDHLDSGSAANAFHDVAEKVSDAVGALKDEKVSIPLDTLQKFRQNLQDFMGEVDKAIAKAKRGPGPSFQS